MNNENFPYVSEELIRALEDVFPNYAPQKHESHEELLWRGGQRSVVDFLKMKHEDQQRSKLEGDL